MKNIAKNLKEPLLFVIVGGIGYVVDVIITASLETPLGVYLARIPAFVGAATATWLLNRSITFKSRKSAHTSLIKEYIHYVSLMLLGLLVNYVVYAISITFLKNSSYAIYICVALGSLAGMTVNYINSKKYIFKPGDSPTR